MRAYLTTHLTIALHASLIALFVFGAAWYVDTALQGVEAKLTANIAESRQTLSELATITDRNGADALTEQIITDCPRRTEFENLLNKLGNATQKELLSAQQLFESCGAFFAERKAFMVAQMEREYDVLQNTLALMSELRDLTTDEIALAKWETLIELEKTRSNFLTEQTTIQAEIITLLIEGGRPQARISELVQQAQAINESLSVTDAQIDEVRLTLL